MQLRSRQSGFVRTEGGLLPADLLERVRALDPKVLGPHAEASYGLEGGERFGEATTRAWNTMVGAWATFKDELAKLPASDPATTTTRERFLLPLMETLGYGRLSPTKAVEIDGKAYPISHAWQDSVPLHLVGANVPLDRRTQRVAGAAGQSPHGLLQEFLNRTSDRLWGIVSNGLVLRILRDNASLTRQAYVEFDLQAIMDGESYADFALLWHLAHRSRLEPRPAEGAEEGTAPTVHGCYLERWTKVAEDTGARARDRLRDGVQEAIEALGSGFIKHPANAQLKAKLQTGELTTQDYYRELLRLVYRLILLFVAEDRDLLLDPKADPDTRERYARYYSMARLRRLAERRKGSRHADLYAGLQVVIAALGRDEGAPGIGLPPLGGFLFGPDGCPHLDGAAVANADLLDAIRKLATIEEAGVLRSVDYRNLASEELGSIYESLLERHPEIDLPSRSFALQVAAGHERKTTGSYYTPSSLISVLLDSALDPVLDETIAKAATKEAKEQAILEFSVVDPAAGSGHFLVAAAHRIAKRLAQVRTEDEEPAPEAIRTALRDVIGHCLYAVDINPMAVELCKVSLWLEALEPGKPLTFLDAHIKCGNSLLGTTPELIAQGIPDAAYDPIEGDDKEVAKALKKRNRQERAGQLSLGEAPTSMLIADLASAIRNIDRVPDISIDAVHDKASKFNELVGSPSYQRARTVADSWCAAFILAKTAGAPVLTTAGLRKIIRDEGHTDEIRRAVARQSAEYRFFHWPMEFPTVFSAGSGFDVVLGNPPWDRVKLQEQEFFAERSPLISTAKTAATRKKLIAALVDDDPSLWAAFKQALRRTDGESHLLRKSGRYPLTGRGDINTYAVFAETFRAIVGHEGRAGLIVPTGVATDDTTKFFFRDLVDGRSLASLYGFENEEFVFPGIAHTVKFCLLTMTGSKRPVPSADFVFFARQAAHVADEHRHFELTPTDFELLNPNTRTSPIFRSRRDAELTKALYSRIPVLVRDGDADGNPWDISFMAMFHMANDSHLFRTGAQLEADGWELRGNTYRLRHEVYVPLYEAKMAHFFDHRFGDFSMHVVADESKGIRALPAVPIDLLERPDFAPQPRYWVPAPAVETRLQERWGHGWLLGWRDVTSAVLVRTLSPSLIPAYGASGKIHLAFPNQPAPLIACLFANLASFAVDFVARQKVGGNAFSDFYMKQIPILAPASYEQPTPWEPSKMLVRWIVERVVELSYTAHDLRAFAGSVGWEGPPFRWSDSRRLQLRAELDAAFMHLYGYERDEVDYVLDSFWVVRDKDVKERGRFRTKDLILEAFDAMETASVERPFVSKLDPDPGDPAAAHPAAAGEPAGRWIPWSDVMLDSSPSERPPSERSMAQDHQPSPRGRRGGDRSSHASQLPLATSQPRFDVWLPEDEVGPRDVQSGTLVRHRNFGQGIVVERRDDGSGTSFVIRFDSGEREISFGYGWLEFRPKG